MVHEGVVGLQREQLTTGLTQVLTLGEGSQALDMKGVKSGPDIRKWEAHYISSHCQLPRLHVQHALQEKGEGNQW